MCKVVRSCTLTPPLSTQGAVMDEMETVLTGSDKYSARFGESIANLGDLDNDGFEGKNL